MAVLSLNTKRSRSFYRVDYSQLEPYLLDDGALEFSLVKIPNANVGPFVGSVHIEQNLLNVSYFTMKLFDGMQTGKMYFLILIMRI